MRFFEENFMRLGLSVTAWSWSPEAVVHRSLYDPVSGTGLE